MAKFWCNIDALNFHIFGAGLRLRIKHENCRLCQFPFIFEGNMYYECVNANNEVPWCANMIDENKTYIDGQRIDCPTPKCSGCKSLLIWTK